MIAMTEGRDGDLAYLTSFSTELDPDPARRARRQAHRRAEGLLREAVDRAKLAEARALVVAAECAEVAALAGVALHELELS